LKVERQSMEESRDRRLEVENKEMYGYVPQLKFSGAVLYLPP
jgi:hypothetical protein